MRRVYWICVPFLLCGCAPSIQFVTNETLNADRFGRGVPVRVKVYVLRTKDNFLKKDVWSFVSGNIQDIAQDAVSQKTVTLLPHTHTTLPIDSVTPKQCIGIVAFFRNPSGTHWRVLALPHQWSGGVLRVMLNGNYMTIKASRREARHV